jgi:predicted DCC family thiol-disulfide oxidoreductase YuxK
VARYEIAIDADCGFCRRSAGWLTALDWLGNVRFNPVHEPGMAEMRVTRLGSGRTLGGFDGFRMMAWSVPLFAPLWPLLWIPGAAWLGRKSYGWIARHRSELPGGRACAVDLTDSSSSDAASRDRAAGAPKS